MQTQRGKWFVFFFSWPPSVQFPPRLVQQVSRDSWTDLLKHWNYLCRHSAVCVVFGTVRRLPPAVSCVLSVFVVSSGWHPTISRNHTLLYQRERRKEKCQVQRISLVIVVAQIRCASFYLFVINPPTLAQLNSE